MRGVAAVFVLGVAVLIEVVGPRCAFAQEASVRPGDVAAATGGRDLSEAMALLGSQVDGNSMTIEELTTSAWPSAAAAVYRKLSQASADEQYEVLSKWTMPDAKRNAIRLFSIPVPVVGPPKSFARALGERPRDTSFAIASVGPVEAFLCTGWWLAQAADEIGQLPKLRGELEQAAGDGVAKAEPMLMLAQVAGSRGSLDLVGPYLKKEAERVVSAMAIVPDDLAPISVACASLRHDELRQDAITFLAACIEQSSNADQVLLRPLLRIAHATGIQLAHGESTVAVAFGRPFADWVGTSVESAKDLASGQRRAVWLTYEDSLLHFAGGRFDVLFCKYPLVGEFEFRAQTQDGGRVGTDGGLVFGGLHFEATGRNDTLKVWTADVLRPQTIHSPFLRQNAGMVFNGVSVRGDGESTAFESNLHPVWRDKPARKESPWLGLHSSGTKRPVFRELSISSSDAIPSEVSLIAGDDLRGWQTGFFADEIVAPDEEMAAHGWRVAEGELVSLAAEESETPALAQYQRPLLDGETIRYEFFGSDPTSVMHPALGQLAFLLEEGGVRVRWITTGEADWTGLPADNAILEPLSRRGPRPLPLQADDWNAVKVTRDDGVISVMLNEQEVYSRAMEMNADEVFGVYRGNRNGEARVRNAVLSGDWPSELPAGFVENPLRLK